MYMYLYKYAEWPFQAFNSMGLSCATKVLNCSLFLEVGNYPMTHCCFIQLIPVDNRSWNEKMAVWSSRKIVSFGNVLSSHMLLIKQQQ